MEDMDAMDAMDFVSLALIQLKKENTESPCIENATAILKLESALDLIWDRNKRLLKYGSKRNGINDEMG
jgi:hypothetical protein